MNLQDASLQVNKKKTKKALSNILRHVFFHPFLRTHKDYFFQRGYESVRGHFQEI